MIEVIPNWHPIFVHFTVGLVVTSLLFSLGSLIWPDEKKATELAHAARWTLWLGGLTTLLTVLAGLSAYGSVIHDGPSHLAMTDHRNWAIPSALLLWLVSLWVLFRYRKGDALDPVQFTMVFAATVAIGVTGFKGGDLVYRYGLGVQSLPTVTGDGHDHDHGDTGEGHHSLIEKSVEQHDHAVSPSQDETSHDHSSGEEEHHHADDQGGASLEDPAETADAFHAALKSADEDAVARLLAVDVVVLESGHAQHGRADYMSGHMKSDMAFLPDIEREVLDRSVSNSGSLAWVVTHSRMKGHFKDRPIDMMSRELLVMKHNGKAWEISLVHWTEN